MRSMTRAAERLYAGLVLAMLVAAPQVAQAEAGKSKVVHVLARDMAFCKRLAKEAHRLEYVAPILTMPKVEHHVDTRVHKDQRYYVDTNRIYFTDRPLPWPREAIFALLDRKDWRKRLFKAGSPVPPPNARLGYKLVYDKGGYWHALERRAPGFLLHKVKLEGEPETTQAPDWYALYAVDLDGDGVGEHVLHRRFPARGGNKHASAVQYFDRIDLTTGKKQRLVVEYNLDATNYLVRYVRYRGRVLLTGRTAFGLWVGESKRHPICIFYELETFNDIWRLGLRFKFRQR